MGAGPAPGQKLYPIVFPWHTTLHRGSRRLGKVGAMAAEARGQCEFFFILVPGRGSAVSQTPDARGELPGADCDLTERDAAFQSVPVGGSLE